MSSASTSSSPQCAVILALAHLLRQHSLSYDDEKNALLDASVQRAAEMANRGDTAGEEVHVVLTGSPRPTFAETNAWLLEGQPGSPAKPPATPRRRGGAGNNDGDAAAAGGATAEEEDDMSVDEEEEGNGGTAASGAQLLQDYIAECTHGSSTRNANMDDLGGSPTRLGGSVLDRYRERTQSADGMVNVESHLDNGNDETMEDGEAQDEIDESEHSKGPMVGQAVVNAVSQQKGVGLRSSRAMLLQGTIDRPLWDQRRWTDGECLFSELVDKCGLESFENVGIAGSHVGQGSSGGADAAGGGARPSSNLGETGLRLQKTTNLSAHLITVPATIVTQTDTSAEVPGMATDITEEIARGILRCLKRKKSPPASKVMIVLPPDMKGEKDTERRQVVLSRLSAAWQKLEQYNDMIGAPRLMADASLEFVDILL
ncbi:hypothetical protein ACHAXT_002772 [Thalassiosira profunda]